jgi:hypothetical protein
VAGGIIYGSQKEHFLLMSFSVVGSSKKCEPADD